MVGSALPQSKAQNMAVEPMDQKLKGLDGLVLVLRGAVTILKIYSAHALSGKSLSKEVAVSRRSEHRKENAKGDNDDNDYFGQVMGSIRWGLCRI